MRTEIVYLVDSNGDPYQMSDTWVDRWALDEDGNQTEDVESVLVFSVRRAPSDEEITKEEYEAMLPAYEERVAQREAEIAKYLEDSAVAHHKAVDGAVSKLNELGLTPEEAAAVAALPAEIFEALGVGEND